MSGGLGSVLHAIKSMANNKRNKKNILNNTSKEDLNYQGNEPIVLRKASEEDRKKTAAKIKNHHKAERVKLIAVIIVISLVAMLFYFIS